ncbi:hypothetical protein [Nostoc sp. C110]|uniref:hypothetical protein n=1 Tax=Nostoc sp. C110 TaxID=3349876 RepID=UPI00370D7F0A
MSDCRTENTEGEEIERIICVSFGILFYLEVPYTLDKIPAAVGEYGFQSPIRRNPQKG